MFFREHVHISEVIKWGILAGLCEGAFLAIGAVLIGRQSQLFSGQGWELGAALVLLVFIAISAIITTVIVFAHPIYSLVRGHTRDGLYTILVTMLTLLAVLGLVLFSYQLLFA